jgi:cytochrome c peroxidase
MKARFLAIGGLLALALTALGAQPSAVRDEWTPQELKTLASMRLKQAGPAATDPSNAYQARPEAAVLGRALFNDTRLSRNGKVSCASCHNADQQFQDGRKVGEGIAAGKRRTMPVMDASRSPFLFWDGRKDSTWSQALGPMEDAAEHGANRARLAQLVRENYSGDYRKVFGPMPDLGPAPLDASPNGTDTERAAWAALPEARRDGINRVFSNVGKAIAAYEKQVTFGESRFDRYVEATLARDARGQEGLTPQEVRGLRAFLGKGQCVTCHNGPLFTDFSFHNTGVPPRDPSNPDRGRIDGIAKLVKDDFNCLGRYSDAKPEQCGELQFLSTQDSSLLGAFRTPSLRNVAARAPYMHAGQFASLDEVVQHYARSPRAAIGHSELAQPGERHGDRQQIRLSESDIRDVAAFLGALTGPVIQPN